MMILINKTHYPVAALGPGTRAGIWMQGCTIRCPGCLSRDTWPARADAGVAVSSVVEWVGGLPSGAVDGVTISGGEPFDQPAALAELLDGLDLWRRRVGRDIDLLCYSGRTLDELESSFPAILARLDTVIAGPFVQGLDGDLALRGSANQEIVPLTVLGRDRYSSVDAACPRERMQVVVEESAVWFVGIPRQGDLPRVEEDLRACGIDLRRHSWLS